MFGLEKNIPDPPASHLLSGFILIVLYLAAGHGISRLYYQRTGRRRWTPSDGLSSFPLFHFNAFEWLLSIAAFKNRGQSRLLIGDGHDHG